MSEIRIYVVNIENLTELEIDTIVTKQMSDFVFMEIAEQQGTVYTLDNFLNALDNDEIDVYNSYFRKVTI